MFGLIQKLERQRLPGINNVLTINGINSIRKGFYKVRVLKS
ncbi:hypothetical protein ADIARSV_2189 [Arcticibacter svalbardensis MN12-7]|uniref:Uncharacterized protein n=1 Tax=Arcticibacter svalbardensis MN12-7 TaxID=1150600 RepID=R9GSA0_9SPHI|nr:hypothetical protein ADIARSV_2189 [Arcticibacter svalbardensis MN12-7]